MNDTAQVTATVVLIGPPSTGKTTLAPILAERLGLECVSLDDLRWAYYNEIGFDHDHRNGAWGGILRSFDRRGIAPPTVERLRRAVGVDTHNRTFFLFNTNIRL